MDDLFDALDRFGREVTAVVPGALYVSASGGTLARELTVTFWRNSVEFDLVLSDAGAMLCSPSGVIHYADGDWKRMLAERFGGVS